MAASLPGRVLGRRGQAGHLDGTLRAGAGVRGGDRAADRVRRTGRSSIQWRAATSRRYRRIVGTGSAASASTAAEGHAGQASTDAGPGVPFSGAGHLPAGTPFALLSADTLKRRGKPVSQINVSPEGRDSGVGAVLAVLLVLVLVAFLVWALAFGGFRTVSGAPAGGTAPPSGSTVNVNPSVNVNPPANNSGGTSGGTTAPSGGNTAPSGGTQPPPYKP